MKTFEALEALLWKDYAAMNPQADGIHKALRKRGEKVVNDHIAFRTFQHPKTDLEVLARPFAELGYKTRGDGYHFKEKKLFARHWQHPDPARPKVFISALKIKECSPALQKIVDGLMDQIPDALTKRDDFLVSGTPWKPVAWETYQALLKESEYAAWMAAFGFRVNHFTVFFNALRGFKTLAALNTFLKETGYELNASGGEIKGTPAELLEQSSTLASQVSVKFADRTATIPGCYYEFARRYAGPDGKLFQGFIPQSADKIFESTDYR